MRCLAPGVHSGWRIHNSTEGNPVKISRRDSGDPGSRHDRDCRIRHGANGVGGLSHCGQDRIGADDDRQRGPRQLELERAISSPAPM